MKPAMVLLAVCVAISVSVSLFAAMHRLPWPDEGDFASPAWNLAHRGFMGTTAIDPDAQRLPGIDRRTYWVLPGYLLLQAAWYLAAPPDIFWSRMSTVLMIPLLAWAAYALGRGLTNSRLTGAVAAGILVLDYTFLYSSSWARPEIFVLLLGLASLAVYVNGRERHYGRTVLLSHTLMAAAMFTHPNAVLHAAGLALLTIVLDRQRLTVRVIAAAALPYVALAAAYGVYVAQDVATWQAQMGVNAVGNRRFAATLNPIALVWDEIRERYLRAYGVLSDSLVVRVKGLVLLLYFAAVAAAIALLRRNRDRGLALVLGLLAVYFAIQSVFNQKLTIYLVHILFWYALLLAYAAVTIARRADWRGRAAAAALALVVLVQPAGMLAMAAQRSHRADHARVREIIKARGGCERGIAASESFWFTLGPECRVRSDSRAGVLTGRRPELIIIDSFYAERHAELAQTDPSLAGRIAARLRDEYRLIYTHGDYRVYEIAEPVQIRSGAHNISLKSGN